MIHVLLPAALILLCAAFLAPDPPATFLAVIAVVLFFAWLMALVVVGRRES